MVVSFLLEEDKAASVDVRYFDHSVCNKLDPFLHLIISLDSAEIN